MRRVIRGMLLFPICTLSVFMIIGCAAKTSLVAVSDCKPLSQFSNVNLTTFDTGLTIVSNVMMGDAAATMKGYARELNNQIRIQLEETKRFGKVTQDSECLEPSMKIEGAVVAFEKDQTKIHVMVRGSILKCATSEALYRFALDDLDSELHRTAEIIAYNLVADVIHQMSCEVRGLGLLTQKCDLVYDKRSLKERASQTLTCNSPLAGLSGCEFLYSSDNDNISVSRCRNGCRYYYSISPNGELITRRQSSDPTRNYSSSDKDCDTDGTYIHDYLTSVMKR